MSRPDRAIAAAVLTGAMCLAAYGLRAGGGQPPSAAARGEVSDADLERAGGRRTVTVGPAGGGRAASSPLEVYVARVIAGEGEPGAPEATLEALAIAIRTFALANAGRHARDGFDLCDGTHCQVPRAATPATRRAALATAGRVLVYDGSPAAVFYSASCGGHSEDAALVWPGANFPYLRAAVDDVHAEDAPWTLVRTLREIQQALAPAGFAGGRLTDVAVEARSDSGRATRIGLAGLRPATIAGEAFRAALGTRALRSTAFSVARDGTSVRFTGRGYGHGVGMCVVGAGRRARRGETVEQILAAYYPGLELRDLDAPGASPGGAGRVAPEGGRRVEAAPRANPLKAAGAMPRGVTAVVPSSAPAYARDLEARAARARDAVAAMLGVDPAPVAVALHDTIDAFRAATGRPWWTAYDVGPSAITLGPTTLTDAAAFEMAVAAAIAERLMAPAFEGRPLWTRVGGGRYAARALAARDAAPPSLPAPTADARRSRAVCPSDAELTRAVSAAAQRDAESRAEACFARAFGESGNWRNTGSR